MNLELVTNMGSVDFLLKESKFLELTDYDPSDPDTIIFQVTLDCWNYALKQMPSDSKIIDSLRLGMTYWSNLVDKTKSSPDKYYPVEKYMYILCLKLSFEAMSDDHKSTKKLIIDALNTYMNELSNTPELFPEDPFKVHGPSDEELAKAVISADDNLLMEFFTTLKEVGSFHQNLDDYDDPVQREKAVKLYAIYKKIMKLD